MFVNIGSEGFMLPLPQPQILGGGHLVRQILVIILYVLGHNVSRLSPWSSFRIAWPGCTRKFSCNDICLLFV